MSRILHTPYVCLRTDPAIIQALHKAAEQANDSESVVDDGSNCLPQEGGGRDGLPHPARIQTPKSCGGRVRSG